MRSRSTDLREPRRARAGRWALAALLVAVACHREAPPVVAPPVSIPVEPSRAPEPLPKPEPLRLHLSFDDAPWMEEPGRVGVDAAAVTEVNEAIVAALRAHGVPASVFFNCDRLQPGERSVELWAAADLDVGNHTSSHANLAKVPLDAWIDDVRRCHDVLSARLPAPPRWFRYPYLSQGDSVELRDQARERLTALGYANAHVTVATTEWLLAFAYRRAKRSGDQALMDELVQAYRAHMVEAVEQGRALARQVVGRETAQVVLFHVNELAADHLDEVLADYEAQGYALVSLSEALADPVFDLPDHYVGRGGLSWLFRVPEDPETRPEYWFGHEEARLMKIYGAAMQPEGS